MPSELFFRRVRKRTAQIGMLAFVLLPASASGGRDGGPVLLRMKFKQGDVTKYHMTIQVKRHVTGHPKIESWVADSVTQQKVDKILPNGDAEVLNIVLSKQATENGLTRPMAMPPPITLIYDSRGRAKAKPGAQSAAASSSGLDARITDPFALDESPAALPAHPVRPGDRWTATVTLDSYGDGITHYKYIGTEQIGRFRTAHIHWIMSISLTGALTFSDSTPPVADRSGMVKLMGDSYYSIADGRVVRATGTLTSEDSILARQADATHQTVEQSETYSITTAP